MTTKEKTGKTRKTPLLKVPGAHVTSVKMLEGEERCPSQPNINPPCPVPSSPALTHTELGLYTTDFEGQFSMSNSLFGVQWVEKRAECWKEHEPQSIMTVLLVRYCNPV